MSYKDKALFRTDLAYHAVDNHLLGSLIKTGRWLIEQHEAGSTKEEPRHAHQATLSA